MIGSDTFIIVALRCTENRTPRSLASATCSRRNVSSAARRMTAASITSPARTGVRSLSTVVCPSAPTCSMRTAPSAATVVDVSECRKSPSLIVDTCDFESDDHGAHRVRVLARVRLHRGRRAAVGVALAQHRVDRGALDLVVGLRGVLVVGQVVAVLAQFGDGRLQLRQRGRDVGQLDDVRLGRGGQFAQLGEHVGLPARARRGSGRRARCRAARPRPRPARRTPR